VETNPKFLKISESPSANPDTAQQLYAGLFSATVPSLSKHTLDEEDVEELYPAGEDIAHERLAAFVQNKVKRYDISRDCLQEQDHQSLSPYIVSGVLSSRHCVAAARAVNNNKIIVGSNGVKSWIKELIWRVRITALSR
jgi:deoxyribodipyrimidine photo-lyase